MVLIILLYLPGTTSACAENTLFTAASLNAPRNYLRVRGEYTPSDWTVTCQPELPPRARRILDFGAGASLATRNYLRVRGEYNIIGNKTIQAAELPPRARRIRLHEIHSLKI